MGGANHTQVERHCEKGWKKGLFLLMKGNQSEIFSSEEYTLFIQPTSTDPSTKAEKDERKRWDQPAVDLSNLTPERTEKYTIIEITPHYSLFSVC